MVPAFKPIKEKINSIQHGLLRFRDEQLQLSFLIKAVAGNNGSINCVIDEDIPHEKLLNRNVSLIQKRNYDFLYIAGKIAAETTNGSKVLSLQVLKASWFVRQIRGNQSWLEERYIFEENSKKRIG